MAVKAGRIVGGFAWVMTGEGLKAVLQLILLSILARILAPHDYGLQALLLIPTSFIEIFSNMGTRQALIQKPVITPDHLSTSFYLNIGSGFFIWFLLILASGPIADFFREPDIAILLPVIGVIFPIKAVSLTSQAMLSRHLGFRKLSLIDLAGFVIGNFGVGLTLAWLGYGVWALVLAYVVQTLVSSAAQVFYVRHSIRPRIVPQIAKELLSYGGWISVAQIANFLGNKGDNLIVGRFFDAASLGIYTRAFGFAMLPMSLVASSIDRVLFPTMAEAQHDREELRQIFSRSVAAVAMLLIPMSVVAAILAHELVATVLGAQWHEVVLPFQILISITYFRTSYKIDASLSKALGHVRLHAMQHVMYGVLVFVFALIGKSWGVPGVALGVTGAVMAQFLFRRISSMRMLQIGWRDIVKEYFPAIVFTIPHAAMAMAVHVLGDSMALHAWQTLLLAVVLTPPIFGVTLFAMWKLGLADDLLWLYSRFRKRLKRNNVSDVAATGTDA